MKNTIRKLFPLMLALVLLLTVTACQNKADLASSAPAATTTAGGAADVTTGDVANSSETDNGEETDPSGEGNATGSTANGGATTKGGTTKGGTTKSTTAKTTSNNGYVNDGKVNLGVTVPKGKYDFKGGTVTVAVWTDKGQPELGNSEAEDARYYAMHYAMQKYNIGKIEYKQYAGSAEDYNTTFIKYAASGDYFADVMNTMSWYIDSYVQQKLVQDLTPHLGELNTKYFYTNPASVGSGNYGFSTRGAIQMREAYLIYNTDLIKANNLTDPQTLYNQKKWTMDTYRDYVRTITDANRDIYGMAIGNFHQLFNSPDLSDVYYDSAAKKYKTSFLGGGNYARINALYEWLFALYNDGSVLGDFLIGQPALDQGRDAFRNGKIGFLFGTNDLCGTFKSEGIKNFSVVAAPTQDGSHKYYNSSAHFSFYTLPSKNTKYEAKALLAVCNDMFCTTDSSRGKAYYVQDEEEFAEELYADYFLSLKDAKYLIELGKVTTTDYPISIFAKESFQVAREMVQPVLQGKTTWARVLAQYGPVRQKDLDDSLNSLYK